MVRIFYGENQENQQINVTYPSLPPSASLACPQSKREGEYLKA